MQRVFLHIDLDAFFASVEQLDHPDWKGKPVIVGGRPGDRRAVVSTASYEARAYGVHSAMPLSEAVKRCPQGIFVRGNMRHYHEKSEEVMAIFRNYSPDVQQMSVDEAFVDITGTERLFGPLEDTARRLKREVFEKTGLTVSVGMAQTRYVAKIASALHKPDGLCIVPAGEETTFMLSLPLEKVWGAGAKTQAKLRAAGLFTCRDVYTRSLPLLQSLFGKAGGSFLYNAVRGGEADTFTREVKSHSISSENTYSYDLTDRDAIETALLELSYTVEFRLLRENARSSSVSVKIRYDDFSTVSIQESSDRNITSSDDLYERAKVLFYRKYEAGRGIRLLGIAAQNVEDASKPQQAELFDFGEEKRRKVESAILAAKQKNPSLHITKARLLESPGTHRALLLPLLAATLIAASPAPAHAETESETERTSDGAGSIVFDTSVLPLLQTGSTTTLFDSTVHGKDISFLAQGYWQALLTGNASYSFGFGSTPAFSSATPVFSQKVDLNLWFMLDHHWYFEAAFADEFETNTVAAGYTAGSGIVKEARIANRGIGFPSCYSITDVSREIGGGTDAINQAPGFSLQLGGRFWRADAAFRYDLLAAEEKSWYGKNSVSTQAIALADWLSGSQYVLPTADAVQRVSAVYVESASGNARDKNGRRYKKLDESQYLLVASGCYVLLSKDAGAAKSSGALPAVAFAFSGGVPATDAFVEDTRQAFADGGCDIEPYLYPLTGSIDGKEVLYVQHPAGFSPFAAAYRYDAGISAVSDAVIASNSTGTASSTFLAAVTDDEAAFTTSDFFYDSHVYVDVYTEENAALPLTNAKVRFPFAEREPGVYLGYAQTTDLALSVRSYTAVQRFDIGTKAVPGTVRVYKNGILDSGARYDSESGTITLSTAVSASDHIYATWYEDSDASSTGTLAGAAGVQWLFTPQLTGDVSSAARWTYAGGREFSDSACNAPAYATLASKIVYSGERLTLSNTVAASVETADTTGLYRVLGMDDAESDWCALTKTAACDLPEDFAPTLNARPSEADSAAETITLLSANCGSVAAEDGSSDSALPVGYANAVRWDFSNASASDSAPAWASTALSLPAAKSTLASSSRFTLYMRAAEPVSGIKVYLQLGVEADDDFYAEDSARIPTWLISEGSAPDIAAAFDTASTDWQTVTVVLQDEDRARFCAHQDARIVITSADGTPTQGAIYAGSYQTNGVCFSIDAGNALTVAQSQEADGTLSGAKVKKCNTGTNYVQRFDWKAQGESETAAGSEDDFLFTASRYFDEADLQNYGSLSLYFKIDAKDADIAALSESSTVTPPLETESALALTLSRPAESGEKDALTVGIAHKTLKELLHADGESARWHELCVDLADGSVKIDGSTITPAAGSFALDRTVAPTRIQMQLSTLYADGSTSARFYKSGTLFIDELTLSDAATSVLLQDVARAAWKQNGALITTAGGKALLSNVALSAETSASAAKQLTESAQMQTERALNAQAQLDATVLGVRFSASAARDTDTNAPLSSASHRVQSEKALLGVLTFSESYSYSAQEEALSKADSAQLDFQALGFPFCILAQTSATSDLRTESQKAQASARFEKGMFSFNAGANAQQQKTASAAEDFTESYLQGWKTATALAFDTGAEDAKRRALGFSAEGAIQLPLLRFKPTVSVSNDGAYKYSSATLFTDSASSSFSLPFSVDRHHFAVSWTKKAGGVSYSTCGGNYMRDTSDLLSADGEKSWYWKTLPIYDLVSASLSRDILSDSSMTASSTESLYYEGSYAASWKRDIFGTKYDIMLPTNMSVTFSRSIRTASSVSDFYQLKATIGYTALNVFGSAGTIPVARWFSQDEYSASGSATLKIPRAAGASVTMLYTTYVQASFYVSKANLFKVGFEGSFETKDDWSDKLTAVWKRRGVVSPMLGLVDLFSRRELAAHATLTRTDRLNLSAASVSGKKQNTLQYAGALQHQLDIALSDTVTLNAAVGGSYTSIHGTSMTIAANASLGATIRF